MTRIASIAAVAACVLVMASLALPERKLLIWNVTASVPTGLYRLHHGKRIMVGDYIAIAPPPAMRRWLSQRGYLPNGLPLLKRVAAVQGQQICRFRHGITLDNKLVALARSRDRLGRSLPVWSGCRTLRKNEFFALNPDRADSLDGRYFGALPGEAILGRAVPIWTQKHAPIAAAPADPMGRNGWMIPTED